MKINKVSIFKRVHHVETRWSPFFTFEPALLSPLGVSSENLLNLHGAFLYMLLKAFKESHLPEWKRFSQKKIKQIALASFMASSFVFLQRSFYFKMFTDKQWNIHRVLNLEIAYHCFHLNLTMKFKVVVIIDKALYNW